MDYNTTGYSPSDSSGYDEDLRLLLERAYAEDLGERGDVTSEAVFSNEMGNAYLLCKADGVLAGSDAFAGAFRFLSNDASVEFAARDGDVVSAGSRVAEIHAPVRILLSAERTALNLICYLSGIATATRRFVEAAKLGGTASILDTRKTLPGFRRAAKRAVRAGGGQNHRMGLYDMVLLKNNHIDACGGVTTAVERVRSRWGGELRVEVECRNIREVRHALASRVDMIMLDNMGLDETRNTIAEIRATDPAVKIECSGDMDEARVEAYSAAGPDFISVGRLTHSVRSLDFSLRMR